MSAAAPGALWCPESPAARLRALDDAGQLGQRLAALAESDAHDPPTGEAASRALLGDGRAPSLDGLLRLVASHGPETVPEGWRLGPPPRLWERLLRAAGVRPGPGETLWIDEERQGLPAGWRGPAHSEWWASPAHPGASFDGRLWAWGCVDEHAPATAALAALSPRALWRSDGHAWRTHPVALAAVRDLGQARPRIEEGPGFLLACVVDAVGDLAGTVDLSERDRATLWGALLLPLLAPSHAGGPPRGTAVSEPPPDYQQLVAFALLHPRMQEAIAALDRLATILAMEDWHAAAALAAAAGAPRAGGLRAGMLRLGEALAAAMLRRDAAAGWDSGFGFRLVRSVLRDVFGEDPGDFAARWDAATAGPPGVPGVGSLAERLREALSTALGFPGRPPFPGGPAAAQLVELTWARWTDPTYLA